MPVLTKVFGGLGNQMFQYAVGRALSLRLGQALEVDIRTLFREGAAHNGYELSRVFRIDPSQATDASVRRLLGWRGLRTAQRVMKVGVRRGVPVKWTRPYVPEPHFHYWSGIAELDDGCYLDGYWQSPRYFEAVAGTIRQDFAFRHALSGENERIAREIGGCDASVSLHVRRGDYVTNPRATSHHGLMGVDYYRRAVDALALGRASHSPTFFVFSDDIAWAAAELPLPEDTRFISHNSGSDSHFDLQLMSLCRHHIVANSSFSWWAAWLGQHDGSIVVAPKTWFRAPYDTRTLTPDEWIRV